MSSCVEAARCSGWSGRLIFLDRSPDNLTATADRPLSADQEALRRRYAERYDLYCAAADLRVDTCALEGMDPAAYDRILHLENSPYYTLCALALGYRNEEADKYARLAKVRFDRDEVIPVI